MTKEKIIEEFYENNVNRINDLVTPQADVLIILIDLAKFIQQKTIRDARSIIANAIGVSPFKKGELITKINDLKQKQKG